MKLNVLIGIFCLVFSSLATAWDGETNGKIDIIEAEPGKPYSFRIWLEGAPTLCGNNNKWAYLNLETQNYETIVSMLLAAKFSKANVKIYANVSSQNYCEIKHIQVW